MAKVFLLTTAEPPPADRPFAGRDFVRMASAASADRFRVHTTTDDPEEADVILFVGAAHADLRDVRRHGFVRHFREKCFLFESGDRVIPFLPGVYACAEKGWFPPQRTRTGFYLRVFENEAVVHEPVIPDDANLFSFVGRVDNAAVRRRIAELHDPRGFVADTSRDTIAQTDDAAGANAERWSRYAGVLRQSRFVLCPRGLGTSTWRLFEAMKAGRAPVILSDAWIPPDGPPWEAFSIWVRERDVATIPELLAARESEAAAMGTRARVEWENWFSREVAFHRTVESCLAIARKRRLPESVLRLPVYAQLLRPFFLRHFVLGGIKRALLGP
jgi:Exostosin family